MSIYKRYFYLLITPAIILYTLVVMIPFITGIVYSFTAWRGTYFDKSKGLFVGFDNYVAALKNEKFINSFLYTTLYAIIAVVAITTVSLLLAILIDKVRKSEGLFRTTLFMPNLLGGLALGYIWQFIFEIVYSKVLFADTGILHVEFLTYLTQGKYKALIALIIMTTWQYAGYMLIIFTAGINSIPKDIYEAADIDGASPWTRFRKITMPLLAPSFTIVIFLNLANSFKLLDQNVALTNGAFDTRMLALQILRTVKDKTPPDYGQAQAQAVIFFIVIALITLFQVRFNKSKEVEA